jgi:hypothetical protein
MIRRRRQPEKGAPWGTPGGGMRGTVHQLAGVLAWMKVRKIMDTTYTHRNLYGAKSKIAGVPYLEGWR